MSSMVFFCVIVSGLAYFGASVFGLNAWSKVAVILVFGVWSAGLMTSSAFVMVKQMEHVKIRKIIDGQDKVFVTFKLGPFGYTIEVPEEKTTTEDN